MTTIEKAIRDIAPDYVIGYKKQAEIDAAKRAGIDHLIAENLAARVEDMRQDFAAERTPPIDPEWVPVGLLLDSVDLSRDLRGYGTGAASYRILAQLDRDANFELGRSIGHREADPITAIYRAVLGREPDPEGAEFYRQYWQAGVPLSALVADMEQSAEARVEQLARN